MTRPTVKSLITEDLGYCCEWFFFQRFKRTSVIAARLGMCKRAVQYAKARVEAGQCECENRENCMKAFVNKKRFPEWATLAGDTLREPTSKVR